MRRLKLILLPMLLAITGADASAAEYKRLCEASAGVYLDALHFAVASDETNTLQIYRRGEAKPIGKGIDLEEFTSFEKSDLEGAARIGDRVYWISSHSLNKNGKDRDERKVFFATRITTKKGRPSLVEVGRPVTGLRDAIAEAAGVTKEEMNIEALAATPEGGLLIGMRAPLRDGKAVVVALKNPAAVVDQQQKPELTAMEPIDLEGRGLRSMDLVGSDYVIVAGPIKDGTEGFALFRWAGPGTRPAKISGTDLTGLTPEAVMAVPNEGVLQVLSDDGEICGEKKPKNQSFRSIDVRP
jgi:hypothetical protein